jgi:anti-sigma regulatory factor (Ser/Thr protein kinase)
VQVKKAIPANPEGLQDLHTAFDEFFAEASGSGMSDEDRLALLTAAGEVAANIVEHACTHLPEAEMLLELSVRHGGFEVAFTDPGTEYDTVEGPPAADGAEGGRGLSLVRASVDAVEYSRVDDANRWRLVRRRHP